MLSKKDLRAAAAASRELAMECVNGTAPEFGTGGEFDGAGKPVCASGHVCARAGLHGSNKYLLGSPIYSSLPTGDGRAPWWIVTEANDRAASHWARLARLPFALLFLADELENAARRSRPQKAP